MFSILTVLGVLPLTSIITFLFISPNICTSPFIFTLLPPPPLSLSTLVSPCATIQFITADVVFINYCETATFVNSMQSNGCTMVQITPKFNWFDSQNNEYLVWHLLHLWQYGTISEVNIWCMIHINNLVWVSPQYKHMWNDFENGNKKTRLYYTRDGEWTKLIIIRYRW